jgi:hypothetical protein
VLQDRRRSSPSFVRLQISLVSISLPALSCATPSTSQCAAPSLISASLIEPAEWSQRTTISRMETTLRHLFASFAAPPVTWTPTHWARSYSHSPRLPWLCCALPTLQGRGWGEYISHVWISDLAVRDTARARNVGVWGDEGGQPEPEAIRVPRVKERLESLWASPRVDTLCNYQQTPRRR